MTDIVPDGSDVPIAGNGEAGGGTGAEEGMEEPIEPVELLVQMADDGEIDPWDIDVVAVTDAFLSRLDESDLRTGGRALFYASVLVRMKSDALLRDGDGDRARGAETGAEAGAGAGTGGVEEPGAGPGGAALGTGPLAGPGEGPDDVRGDPFAELEREMDRRLSRKRARGTPRTLDELVRDLRAQERNSYWKPHREYDTTDSPSGFERGTQNLDYRLDDDRRLDQEPTEADVTGTGHDEHMEDVISEVYVALREHYDAGREEVLYAEVSRAGGSPVETFLALLFLANRGQVLLQQDELFGDLWVQDPAAVSGPEGPIPT